MPRPLFRNIIITCEHAGNRVPAGYERLFAGREEILKLHRGWDPGAKELAVAISHALEAPLFLYEYTRLLVEPNRSVGHRALFSEFTRKLPVGQKEAVLNRFYRPYRNEVVEAIDSITESGQSVLHISVHTFTPELNGKVRDVDVGLLYDPARPGEKEFCRGWKRELVRRVPDLRTLMNKPYLGVSDGFTTSLRKQFPDEMYGGIELEVNQRFYDEGEESWVRVGQQIARSLLEFAGS
ncbi:MAG: N-formylglutamate amidohydrolase, partial [Balneolaceae bacterium]